MQINPKLLEAVKKFSSTPTLCNWFQLFSIETWERIKFARNRKGLKIFETTITQNLLFELRRTQEVVNNLYPSYHWDIIMSESRNEKANGNDIELYIPFNGGYLFFPVQAKIIYHQGFKRKILMSNGNYPTMDHAINTEDEQQINSLLKYADRRGGYPLYLLYNYVNNAFINDNKCNIDFEIEQYGCSITSARYINSEYYTGGVWEIPTFLDLHPGFAHPWFVLACCFPKVSKKEEIISSYFQNDKDFSADSLKVYSREELTRFDDWRKLDLGKQPMDIFKIEDVDNTKTEFIPKFRIIIEMETITTKKK